VRGAFSTASLGINHVSTNMGNHYVPQYYLHGFAEDGRIWAHDRVASRSFHTQPKVIAHESGMYPDEVEQYLANLIENPAKTAIDKVRNLAPLDDADRLALANYIITLWKRVPEGRRRAAERMPVVAASVKADVLAKIDHLAAEDPSFLLVADEKRAQIASIISHYEEDPPPDIWQKSLRTEFTPRVVDSLLSMEWRYLHTKDLMFLASDNPVFFFAHEGIGQPTSELTLPFSNSVALWANRSKNLPSSIIQASPVAVRELNRRAAYNATRFVFSTNNEPWILPFHSKGQWALNRLQ
jgi:hypothetical protein